MLTVLAQIRETVIVKTAEQRVLNQKEDLKQFVNANPMNWMKQTPLNYSGIIDGSGTADHGNDLAGLPGARWYFDQSKGQLLYKASSLEDLIIDGVPATEDHAILRFRIALHFLDRNKNRQYDENSDKILGLRVQPLQQFEWINLGRTSGQSQQ